VHAGRAQADAVDVSRLHRVLDGSIRYILKEIANGDGREETRSFLVFGADST